MLSFVIRTLVRALKLNLGLNGEGQEHGGTSPEGLVEAFFVNPVIIFAVCFYAGLPPGTITVLSILGCAYVFIMGFFIFPMLKDFLGIEFPSGDGFYSPKRRSAH